MTEGEADALERRLRELDAAIEDLRRQIYAVKHGLRSVPDPEGELTALDARYRDLGRQFVEAYRDWQVRERRGELAAEDGPKGPADPVDAPAGQQEAG